MVWVPLKVMFAVVPATTEALVSKPCATVSTYALFAMSVELDGVVEIVPVVSVTALIVVFVALVICPCAFTAITGTTKDDP